MGIKSLFPNRTIIPVVVLDRADDAVPLAQALLAGGITSMEITLRTAAGLAAIAAVVTHVPQMLVGVGTVMNPQQMQAAADAGARFQMSPGFLESLADYATQKQIAWVPAVATSSDIMRATAYGFNHLKFFPAEALGGPAMLKQLAAVFRDVRFCPTGGLTQMNMATYWALPSVFAIGGSWLAPQTLIAAGEWDKITRIASDSFARITD